MYAILWQTHKPASRGYNGPEISVQKKGHFFKKQRNWLPETRILEPVFQDPCHFCPSNKKAYRTTQLTKTGSKDSWYRAPGNSWPFHWNKKKTHFEKVDLEKKKKQRKVLKTKAWKSEIICLHLDGWEWTKKLNSGKRKPVPCFILIKITKAKSCLW